MNLKGIAMSIETLINPEGTTSDIQRLVGKYLSFILKDEEYGVEIIKVREIIGLMEITPIPNTPENIKGVINLRGKVIPVIDLRLKFGMNEVEYTNETCIIVLEVGNTLRGIIVDTVSEVLDISEEELEPAPSFGNEVDTGYILGMGKIKNSVKILLDAEKVMSGSEVVHATDAQEEVLN